jgi:D-alanyl-D-alanine dipeptidase
MVELTDILIQDNAEPFVNLESWGFDCCPQYFKLGFSPNAELHARRTVAELLKLAETALPNGLRIRIWDAWRPREVQQKIYQDFFNRFSSKNPAWSQARVKLETEIYVAPANDPFHVPPHSTGGAVDVTLIDSEGLELDMGTGFDHLGPEAGLTYFEGSLLKKSAEICHHRSILLNAMTQARFSPYPGEWWHFDYGNAYWAFRENQTKAFYGESSPSRSNLRTIKS